MNKVKFLISLLFVAISLHAQSQQIITRQGKLSFFSYTSVENIEATNDQVFSIIDLATNEIAITMLMKAFKFKKALMHEHFNESYVESDIFPKASFAGSIMDLDTSNLDTQSKMVEGSLTIHGVSKKIKMPITITKEAGSYIVQGDFEVEVDDFKIKIPPILSSNIAKIISITFRFEYQPYEKE